MLHCAEMLLAVTLYSLEGKSLLKAYLEAKALLDNCQEDDGAKGEEKGTADDGKKRMR